MPPGLFENTAPAAFLCLGREENEEVGTVLAVIIRYQKIKGEGFIWQKTCLT